MGHKQPAVPQQEWNEKRWPCSTTFSRFCVWNSMIWRGMIVRRVEQCAKLQHPPWFSWAWMKVYRRGPCSVPWLQKVQLFISHWNMLGSHMDSPWTAVVGPLPLLWTTVLSSMCWTWLSKTRAKEIAEESHVAVAGGGGGGGCFRRHGLFRPFSVGGTSSERARGYHPELPGGGRNTTQNSNILWWTSLLILARRRGRKRLWFSAKGSRLRLQMNADGSLMLKSLNVQCQPRFELRSRSFLDFWFWWIPGSQNASFEFKRLCSVTRGSAEGVLGG